MTSDWRPCSRTQSIDPAALSARFARNVVRDSCVEGRLSSATIETALLLTSELVSNAVTHGDGVPVIDIDVRPDCLHVAVTDDGPGLPMVQRNNPPLADSGRGLSTLEALAARWGTQRRLPAGKSVWFELDRR